MMEGPKLTFFDHAVRRGAKLISVHACVGLDCILWRVHFVLDILSAPIQNKPAPAYSTETNGVWDQNIAMQKRKTDQERIIYIYTETKREKRKTRLEMEMEMERAGSALLSRLRYL